ncbi:MAG: hypothetical protein L0177_00550 [Chloroflexi bacterium]|nr:hypothetical protein [Chloroflexota bacterium]
MAKKAKENKVDAQAVYKPRSAWRRRFLIAGLVLLLAAAGAGYVYRDALFEARDAAVRQLGLGVALAALWLGVFLFALAKRRRWLRRVRMWLGSVAALALAVGIMDFFAPADGALAFFTLSGEVSLGGVGGDTIVGPDSSGWLGIMRLVGVFVAFLIIMAPIFAADIAILCGRALLSAYLASLLALKKFSRVYRYERKPGLEPQLAAAGAGDEEISPYARIISSYDNPIQSSHRYGAVVKPSSYAPPVSAARPTQYAQLDDDFEDDDDDIPITEDEIEIEDDFEPATPQASFAASEPQLSVAAAAPREAASIPINQLTDKYNKFWEMPGPDEIGEEQAEEEEAPQPAYIEGTAKDWTRPPLDLLLDIEEGGITEKQMLGTAASIKRTLSEYGVEVEIGQIQPGPTVTMYGLIPGWVRRTKQAKALDPNGRPILDEAGKPIVRQEVTKMRVKVDSILSREKDLALSLKTPSIRIETPVMGKSQIGIEVPNPTPSLVTLRSVMKTQEFSRFNEKAALPVALGKGSGGETVLIDLARMPHLLIAGATGSGKSVCLNTIVSCLIMEKTPAELRLLLIDPKRVELTPYNGIPHLLTPVVVDTDKVVGLLKGVIREMFDRYRRMEEAGVRNIDSYNKKMPERMPYIVVAVDELADLMMSAAFDVEQSLCRLAQLGRATGIHLIVATQRPSVDVVTGLIKANFPSRISFGVTSQVDSRTILDSAGAEKLLGRGDMLYSPIDATRPSRVQGVFISDKEIENLVSFWKLAPWARLSIISLHAAAEDDSAHDDSAFDGKDELLEKAIELARTHNKLSTSLLQRRLRIGYPRAARLMDELEEQGVVGPSDGSKSRDVIMNKS